MIDHVRDRWIKGILQPSLSNVVPMSLALNECRDKIDLRGNLEVRLPNRLPRVLPPSAKIIDIFDELGGSFLILGDPGSGKTTLLLQLAEKLLDRADEDDKFPIPVVFHLSTWANRRLSLADWLVEELLLRYGVCNSLGKKWVKEDTILPLLDGLDEVASAQRVQCVENINDFRKHHGLMSFVICSRTEEYNALNVRLNLPTAIFVKPLTRLQIEEHLKKSGTSGEGVIIVLKDDKILWELLETPFMLNIMMSAFKDRSPEDILRTGTLEEKRKQIFDYYKDTMFERTGRSSIKNYSYTRKQTEHWLSWLATSMKRHDQSIFYLEFMQPNWLPSLWLQKVFPIGVLLITSLFSGLMVVGVMILLNASGLVEGIPFTTPLKDWLIGMLSFGFIIGLIGSIGWLVSWRGTPLKNHAERLHFVKSKRLFFVFFVPAIWLIFSLVGEWYPWGIIVLGTFVLLIFIEQIDLDVRKYPNEGIHTSAKNALTLVLLVAPVSALVCGLALWLTKINVYYPETIAGFGMVIGLISGVIFGGYICIQHYLLRLTLGIYNLAPMNYVKFLDYAADRIFLRKIGGGYVFIHRMIMDYFASLEQD